MPAASSPRLLSIQVGAPTTHLRPGSSDPLDRPWRTGFFKAQVDGPLWLGRQNLFGDGQANRKVHGGPDKAVLAYAGAHYRLWRAELGMPELPHGAFAENFTVSDLDESSVCIGDVYAIGDARVQVSQPRQPCSNITRRWRIADFTQRVADTGRTGWYLRVMHEASIQAGQRIELLERPRPDWSVARATRAMVRRALDPAEAAALAALPELSVAWRTTLIRRLRSLA
jgi:MOSC domain-containing protein YiiM